MSTHQFAARELLAFQLRELRKEKRYSQESLAEVCGLNRTYVGAIERAEHNIGIDNIEKLAGGLGVSIIRLVVSGDPDVPCDVSGTPLTSNSQPQVHTSRFLAMVEQCARERPDLLVAYLEQCGVRFFPGEESASQSQGRN